MTSDSGVGGAAGSVTAVGIGPGNPAYVTGNVRDELARADVVVGFETVVGYVDQFVGGDILTCGYDDEEATLERFGERVAAGEHGVAALMGDPNVSGHQFLDSVREAVPGTVTVRPGISSIQVAASRAVVPFEETTFVTLHRRGPLDDELDRIARAAGDRHLLVLPRPYDWMPEDIAAFLFDTAESTDRTNRSELRATVYEHLTHDEERSTETTLGTLAAGSGGNGPEDSAFSDLSVVLVRGDQV
ncbi:cobalt-precorrin-7 (C(5))-methyltransferase [Natranaeroarchaeum sulfidigenes]|uniref:Precorrin-6B methylase 1 n=1 Tax=Natranaeroarchaeum sulfidigenes TaxID=2784880 RepID=A0A897MX41_9EURY|nr:cobalt-precorrin-7 (C(5))-methyltransferase [Natranaeroarchaeum sulfidigenes]QSG03479.1 Precorrin-6B methylase 1 [Natranaeroarchaeum sulfidigenes]